jgi:hypothetical protein
MKDTHLDWDNPNQQDSIFLEKKHKLVLAYMAPISCTEECTILTYTWRRMRKMYV